MSDQSDKVKRVIWNILFTLFYPIVMGFTLLFFGATFLLSWFSKLIRALLHLGKSSDHPIKTDKVDP